MIVAFKSVCLCSCSFSTKETMVMKSFGHLQKMIENTNVCNCCHAEQFFCANAFILVGFFIFLVGNTKKSKISSDTLATVWVKFHPK